MPQDKEKIIGYYADDGSIYCVECIKKTHDAMKMEIEDAITGEESQENCYVCGGCHKELK
jgi:cell fate regulator YaaT (PSP1 superfamily)